MLTTQQQPTGDKTQEAVHPRAHSLSKTEWTGCTWKPIKSNRLLYYWLTPCWHCGSIESLGRIWAEQAGNGASYKEVCPVCRSWCQQRREDCHGRSRWPEHQASRCWKNSLLARTVTYRCSHPLCPRLLWQVKEKCAAPVGSCHLYFPTWCHLWKTEIMTWEIREAHKWANCAEIWFDCRGQDSSSASCSAM